MACISHLLRRLAKRNAFLILEYKVNEISSKNFYIKEHNHMNDNYSHTNLEYDKTEMYKYFDSLLKEIDVAMLYHYTTKNINKAVKRNIDRFLEDFCFQLTESEFQNLRFQFGTLNRKVNNGDVTKKYLPYVFTEQGISMLFGVIKNEIAVKVSVSIIRAFVELRKFLMLNGQVKDY